MTVDEENDIPIPGSGSQADDEVSTDIPSEVADYFPEPRWPCVLLLDNSHSMRENGAIDALNDELRTLKSELESDESLRSCVEVAIVTFGEGVELVQDFTKVGDFDFPVLEADGTDARMTDGILKALEICVTHNKLFEVEHALYHNYHHTLIALITNGGQTDVTRDLIREKAKKIGVANPRSICHFFVRTIEGTNKMRMDQIVPGSEFRLIEDLTLPELFNWTLDEEFHSAPTEDEKDIRLRVILLDTSSSMYQSGALDVVDEAVRRCIRNSHAGWGSSVRVETAIVTFGAGVELVSDFEGNDDFALPDLKAGSPDAQMARGIHKALDAIRARHQVCIEDGIEFRGARVYMVTDREPTGEAEELIADAADRLSIEDRNGRIFFFAVDVVGAMTGDVEMEAPSSSPSLKERTLAELFSPNLENNSLLFDTEGLEDWNDIF